MPPPPTKRMRSLTPPSAERHSVTQANIRHIWAWEESNGRKPDIDTIFDFLNINQRDRYELLKSEFVSSMSAQARTSPEVIDVEAEVSPRYRTQGLEEACQGHILTVAVFDRGTGFDVKLKRTTQMCKLFDAYHERSARMEDNVYFVYKGAVIAATDSAETLGMSDGDIVNVRPQLT